MTLHLTTLSDSSMSRSRELCISSAIKHGARTVKEWTHEQFKETDFYRENETICSQPRGLGYWIFKPYIILDLMNNLPNGETVVYLDAGVETIDNLNYIVDRMDQDIFLFGNMHEHAHWCKRDIIEAIWPWKPSDDLLVELNLKRESVERGEIINLRDLDKCGKQRWDSSRWNRFGKQVQASAIFLRVNDQTKAFVKEWLDWCTFESGRLIDDSPSRTSNHPEFSENRYDQAILTTEAIREGIALHWWPATYQGGSVYPREFKENRHDQAVLTTMAYREKIGLHKWAVKYDLRNGKFFDHESGHYEDDYPVIWRHHRWRNNEFPAEVAA